MGVAARVLPDGVDRAAIGSLTLGHAGADLFQGAVPALVPFLVRDRGLSYAAAGALVLAGSLGSSLLQPIAGTLGDRLRMPWLVPLGLVLGAAGLVGATLASPVALIAVSLVVGGVGVALFHPEAVRAARASAGSSVGAALGVFSVGGSVGFALGPAIVTPMALAFGLGGASVGAVVPLAAAVLLVRVRPGARAITPRAASAEDAPDDWPRFVLAASAASARTGFMFGLLAYVPSWFAEDLGVSVSLGSAAVVALLLAGATGTYIGGRAADRVGRERVVLGSLVATVPLALVLPVAGPVVAFGLLVLIGFVMNANFYPLVVMGQDALPRRAGFASGVVLGLSVGVGAGCAALLGVVADSAGLTAAIAGCAALAALAVALAWPICRRPA